MKPFYEQLEAELAETKRLVETTTDLLKKALEETDRYPVYAKIGKHHQYL